MRLPRAFRPIVQMVHSHASRMLDVSNAPVSPPEYANFGTRSFPGQGLNSEDMTQHISQFSYGDGPMVPNTQGIFTQAPWPQNPGRWEYNPGAGREFLTNTAVQSLQSGTPPGRVPRLLYDRAMGYNGPDFMVGMPYESGQQYMEHMKVPRKALGTKGPQKLSDDNAVIPALFAGNPR